MVKYLSVNFLKTVNRLMFMHGTGKERLSQQRQLLLRRKDYTNAIGSRCLTVRLWKRQITT